MQIGFEEDSPFYTPPSEKNVQPEEAVKKENTPVVEEKKEQPSIEKEQQKPQEDMIRAESKTQETAVVKNVDTVKEETPVVEKEAEGETTFSYSREDGE